MIKNGDCLIELGPEAGDGGGELVFAGKPLDIKKRRKVIPESTYNEL